MFKRLSHAIRIKNNRFRTAISKDSFYEIYNSHSFINADIMYKAKDLLRVYDRLPPVDYHAKDRTGAMLPGTGDTRTDRGAYR